jgi:hypothetical protein
VYKLAVLDKPWARRSEQKNIREPQAPTTLRRNTSWRKAGALAISSAKDDKGQSDDEQRAAPLAALEGESDEEE